MGCDGGSIPKRGDLVKTRGRPVKGLEEKTAQQDAYIYCALSKERLQQPVVICKRGGYLYNKESILRLLIAKKTKIPDAMLENNPLTTHICSLKDVQELRLKDNSADSLFPFACPVTGVDMNGIVKFVYLKGCGCVISEAALRSSEPNICISCGKNRIPNDIIHISPSAEVRNSRSRSPVNRSTTNTFPVKESDLEVPLSRPLQSLSSFHKTKAIGSLYRK